MRYLALLRGINVGGSNIIKMTALKAAFAGLGFTDIKTYIQSGNVVFSSAERQSKKISEKIEKGLSKAFGYEAKVVVVSHKKLSAIVEAAGADFGKNPGKYRYDVVFMRAPLTAKQALKEILVQEGVDQVAAGKDALYFTRLISKASQSKLPKLAALPIYKSMTVRNWNTTSKLLALMDKDV